MRTLFPVVCFLATVLVLQAAAPQHFLIRIWPARGVAFVEQPTEAEGRIMGEHAAYIKRLHEQGKVVLAGPSINGEKTFGLVVVQASSEAEARTILEGDPSYKSGIMRGEVLPFRMFVPASQ
jgi:uncharacterized protein YciI